MRSAGGRGRRSRRTCTPSIEGIGMGIGEWGLGIGEWGAVALWMSLTTPGEGTE
jgi:hypothetical protein